MTMKNIDDNPFDGELEKARARFLAVTQAAVKVLDAKTLNCCAFGIGVHMDRGTGSTETSDAISEDLDLEHRKNKLIVFSGGRADALVPRG